MPDQNTLANFQRLFAGRTDVWGSVKGESIKEAVTEQSYRLHLEGKQSLGIYPLMDDGTVNFWAVDIDEKNFEKAANVRLALGDLGIFMYIAESKGKGYHVYGFGDHIVAADIRYVLRSVLATLGMPNVEVFPKQDKLDDVIKYGNYINLPCYGDKRQFQTASQQSVATEQALALIKPTDPATVTAAKNRLPPPPKPTLPPGVKTQPAGAAKTQETRETKKKGLPSHPPCVETLLKGVGKGCRDEAAFALARHYLDQGYTADEVLAVLLQWNSRNQPPISDERVILDKVTSASKGYPFGCNSIIGEPLLTQFCPDKINGCSWLKNVLKERKKAGLVQYLTFHETETHIYEEVINNNKASFLAFSKQTGEILPMTSIEQGEMTIMPVMGEEILQGAVKLPTIATEYGDIKTLFDLIRAHINRYCDLDQTFQEFAIWYIFMTWVYDRLPTVSYLRFRGDTGCGKSRALKVFGDICYKPMSLAGAITPAPIYRLIRKFRGTVLLDEADFDDSSEKGEVIKILNSGFERGNPIIRCNKDDPDDLQILPCFGPKLFCTRTAFNDKALESRCLTVFMQETARRDIPSFLGGKYNKAVQDIANKMLLWRFRTRSKVNPDLVEDLDIGDIEPRLKQTGIPFASIFLEMPETFDRFKSFMLDYNEKLIRERYESYTGKLVQAFFKTALVMGKEKITSQAVAKMCNEEMKMDLKPATVSRLLQDLNLHTARTRKGGRLGRFYEWNDATMKSLNKRYMPDPEEYAVLFNPDYKPPETLREQEPQQMDMGNAEENSTSEPKLEF